MKKIILAIATISLLSSCTENIRTRSLGADQTIRLPKGEKLIEATWKNSNLWYLTAPMESDYIPQTKIFREDSNFGLMQGTVYFEECR